MIETLYTALKSELEGETLSFHETVPNKIMPPAVIVAPGDPFLTPATHGLIREQWEILVAMKRIDPDRGLSRLREISLKVREAVSQSGALWVETTGPRVVEGDADYVLMINRVEFKYDPADITEESSSS